MNTIRQHSETPKQGNQSPSNSSSRARCICRDSFPKRLACLFDRPCGNSATLHQGVSMPSWQPNATRLGSGQWYEHYNCKAALVTILPPLAISPLNCNKLPAAGSFLDKAMLIIGNPVNERPYHLLQVLITIVGEHEFMTRPWCSPRLIFDSDICLRRP